jgi:hypothetical protein
MLSTGCLSPDYMVLYPRPVVFNLGYAYHWGGTWKHLTSIKMKHRNCLNLEPALIPTLMKIHPWIDVLACKKQAQLSHYHIRTTLIIGKIFSHIILLCKNFLSLLIFILLFNILCLCNIFILNAYYRLCITWAIHQRLWRYKVEEKLCLGYVNKKRWIPLSETTLQILTTLLVQFVYKRLLKIT